MKILAISDVEIPFLYSPQVATRFTGVDLVISCGDLPYFYLEYIFTMLNVPLFYVRGNHHNLTEVGEKQQHESPMGGINISRRHINYQGLLLSGIEGSLRYNNGPVQYTQSEYWGMVYSLVPGLLLNKLRYGRYLDVFVSHAPPLGVHDQKDTAHQGIKAFRWLIDVFHPCLYLHGHIHLYRSGGVAETVMRQTRVINSYGYREVQTTPSPLSETRAA